MKKLCTFFIAWIWVLGASAQYCVPTYTAGPTAGDSIASFQLGTINGTLPGDPSGYNDYTGVASTDLSIGQGYTVTVTNAPLFPIHISVYLDFDNDSIFDVNAGELLGAVELAPGGTANFPFTVSFASTPGLTRVRLVSAFGTLPDTLDPCGSYSYGETEDYHVNILPPAPDDVGADEVISLAYPGYCGLPEPVTVTMTNFGTSAQTSVPMSYSLNGATPVTETAVVNLAALGGVDTFTFATGISLVPNTTYTLQVWTDLAGDAVNFNDTTSITFTSLPSSNVVNTFPYVQDFDAFTPTPGFSPGAPIIALLDGWTNSQADDPQDWAVRNGPTGSFNTGPPADHTSGNGNYIFVEDSGFDNDSTIVLTPCFDISNVTASRFTFWAHSFNGIDPNNENELHVDMLYNGQLIEDVIPPILHDSLNQWTQYEFNTTPFPGIVAFLFRVNNNNNFSVSHDIAIDDVEFIGIPDDDAGIVDISSPNSDCGLSASETLTATLQNFGQNTITSVSVNYTVNGTPGTPFTVTGNVQTDSTLTFSFPGGIDLSVPGPYTINVFTSLGNDANALNDTFSVVVNNILQVSSFPYVEDFENGPGSWLDGGSNNSWAFGTPAKNVITGAASGVNAWVTGGLGTDTYNADEASFVESPCFDFTSLNNPIFRADIWWDAQFSWDGAVLQATTDSGSNWVNVGVFGDPGNWYTDNTINGSFWTPQDGWSGDDFNAGSQGWVTAENSLDFLAGEPDVRLRFAFGSDGFGQDDGFAFDNVEIREAATENLAMLNLDAPVSGCGLTANTDIVVEYAHLGFTAVNTVDFSYSINNGPAVTENQSLVVAPGDTNLYTFSTQADLSAPGTYSITIWLNTPGDTDNGNDTLANIIVENIPAITAYPYVQNFDSWTVTPGFAPGAPVIALPDGWENSQSDDPQDWAIRSGPTGSTNTGPFGDHTTGGGNYVFVEDSSHDPQEEANRR
ncbi:MAG: GEVED domain-containing protein, partial [Bacteroidota bacterium]